jgi:hypothetical protein
MELATAAAALLAPYLAEAGKSVAGKVGDAAVAGITTLYGWIRKRFEDDDDSRGRDALTRLEAQPDDAGNQRALSEVLAAKAEADPSFASELKQLVDGATRGRSANDFLVEVYGGEVNKIVQIGKAGDVSF